MGKTTENRKNVPADYDARYRQKDYFKYMAARWKFYRPFLKSLIAKARLQHGATVLDAGCGQGFFTGLFSELGFDAVGVDVSAQGIAGARESFGNTGARFEVGDALALAYKEEFDCVFVRGCPAYNTAEFAHSTDSTERFLKYLKRGGVLIFDHHTNLCARKRSPNWIWHSLDSVRQQFRRYPASAVYFSSRADTAVLGSMAFSAPITFLNCRLSELTGFGGEAVAFVWKL
jgi:SAM-dependent methyltransferase